ncbi:dolichol-phosphate mannosyltransferase [Sulfolobus acidocaldarius SUSAZ]|nr:dolichol-phosphate mannosyltransferase [Sulfolobus acidocaldarius SUSAZ]
MLGVVIPTYNEAENIRELIPRIKEVDKNINIIIVDDNSPDNTSGIAEQMGAIVFVRKDERGIGSALKFGLEQGVKMGFKRLITMDADLSHDPKYIPDLVSKEADLVIGSRYVKGGAIENWPLQRRLISSGANSIARLLLRFDVRDATSGYRAYSPRAVEAISPCKSADGYEFQICSVYHIFKSGLQIAEVPISFHDREKGKSKLDSQKIFKWFAYVLKLSLS